MVLIDPNPVATIEIKCPKCKDGGTIQFEEGIDDGFSFQYVWRCCKCMGLFTTNEVTKIHWIKKNK